MKKNITKTILGTLVAFAICPAMADIASDANSASCTQPVLGTYEGATNFEAKWNANSINLAWYDGQSNQAMNVQQSARSCTYDGSLTLPTNTMTRTGYTFAGWTVRSGNSGSGNSGNSSALLCGLTESTVNSLVLTDYEAKLGGVYGSSGNLCYSAEDCGLTEPNTWMEVFSDGTTIRGIASCNNTPGPDASAVYDPLDAIDEAAEAGTITWEEAEAQHMAIENSKWGLPGVTSTSAMSTSDTGAYCWCKVTSYTPNAGETCNVSANSAWVTTSFGPYFGDEDAESCSATCAEECNIMIRDYSMFRKALLTSH